MLSNELKTTFKANVHIIPIVITWDGLVTNYHKKHLKKIDVSTNIQAFIQTQVLKRTWESIRVDLREDILEVEYGQMEV